MTQKYTLTPEHEAMLPAWRERWINNALSTALMTDDDRAACVEAVYNMYEAAGLERPKHVVFVSSPFILRYAGGFAAALWYRNKEGDTAAFDKFRKAFLNGAPTGISGAVYNAVAEAIGAPAFTKVPTGKVANTKQDRWFVFDTDSMTQLSNDIGLGKFGCECAANAYRMWSGGNQWPGTDAYLSFFQDIAKLDLPEFKAYSHWRVLAERSGPRVVHPDFCMISDRPEVLTVDEAHRPHSDTGPFCRWRDGSALYAVHGVRVPAWVVEHPDRLNVDTIHAETNTEIQRVMIERFGWDAYADACGAEIIDHDERYGTLMRGPAGLFVRVINRSPEPDGSFRQYILPVSDECEPLPDPADPNATLGEPQKLTARNAVASTFGMRGDEYEQLLGAES